MAVLSAEFGHGDGYCLRRKQAPRRAVGAEQVRRQGGPRPAFVLACAHQSGTALCRCARDRSRAVSNRHRSVAGVALRAARPSATRRLSTCGASPLREEVRSRCPRLLAQHAAARVIHVKREAGRTPDPPHVTVCSGSAHPFDPSSLFRVDM
jgi:hypothetical protein